MDPVRELVEIEAIKRLKYKYLRCIDQKRWDELAETFTEGATCSYGDGKFSDDVPGGGGGPAIQILVDSFRISPF